MSEQSSKPLSLADITVETFLPLTGQTFEVVYPNHREAFTLENVVPSKNAGPPGGRRPFSLFFRGESKTVLLHQQIHPLRHATLGTLEIFLVPVSRYADGTHRYQAVFN